MLSAESQMDEVHADKVRKIKDQPIIISEFKTGVTPILGEMG